MAFAPTDIASLNLWLAADAPASITQDSNGLVSQWADQSPNAANVTQSTDADKPRASGGCRLTFDGTNMLSHSEAGSGLSGTSGEFWCAFRYSADMGTTQYLLTSSADDFGSYMSFGMARLGGDLTHRLATLCRPIPHSNPVNAVYGSTHLQIGAMYVVRVRASGGVWSLYVNGVEEAITVSSGTNAGQWFGNVPSLTNFAIGAFKALTTVNQPLNGAINEIAVFNAPLSTENAALMQAYMNRWLFTVRSGSVDGRVATTGAVSGQIITTGGIG